MFYSGEVHPFRLPVPSLWLDIFQKIRSMGYTGVSFYIDWALLEGTPGTIRASGVFALEPFFDAAQKAGIYLLARPGPYINAEASGGGFPGWLARLPGRLRTADAAYLNASDLYTSVIGAKIAAAQITHGGPVILFQPENEYTSATRGVPFPDPIYMRAVQAQYRRAGITVPMVSNDAGIKGNNAPGTEGGLDIYGHDGYPLGFNCAHPDNWPKGNLPTNWRDMHYQISPATPYAIPEFQGGAFDPWGGPGYEKCAQLVNHEYERVFYKNDISFGVTIFNLYMTYGGTNWGNLGHPGGYTSYDYGAAITEERGINRTKYSEAKLIANSILASPAYLSAFAEFGTNGTFVNNSALSITRLQGSDVQTQFFVIRHTAYNSKKSEPYRLTIPTSAGTMRIPQAAGALTLHGRDSKIMVTDFDLGGINILYSTAEILTWQKYTDRTILVIYTGSNEQHELAITESTLGNASTVDVDPRFIEGAGESVSAASTENGHVVLSFKSAAQDRIVRVANLYIHILDRDSAHKTWVLPFTPDAPTSASVPYYIQPGVSNAIIHGGYLMRTAAVIGREMALTGDIDRTTTIRILGGAPRPLTALYFNDMRTPIPFEQDEATGIVTAELEFREPVIKLPKLSKLQWYTVDSLPEVSGNYSDAGWTPATMTNSLNPRRPTTPTSLYASDYGYHAGSILYRGHFRGNGRESSISLTTQGGSAFGMSAWLDSTYLGSWRGHPDAEAHNSTFSIGPQTAGSPHVLTVGIDHMGLDENWNVGADQMKKPRGILDYKLAGHAATDVSWKVTGNLGGESYHDHARGPLNEGGLYAERAGFHLPSPPVNGAGWRASAGPTEGIARAGIALFTTSFNLDIPAGYDVPLSLQFKNGTGGEVPAGSTWAAYRAQVWVNGWQFGKYVHTLGPQTRFPVPEGIWNYRGRNWVAVSLWAMEEGGAHVEGLELVAGQAVQTGLGEVKVVESPGWKGREGVY
ncbi:beta-galactosidase [Trichodelitschia bisporula]|uniref:Beta-galactosidase n=1 Tax=Trichodelitschia bisporula TaxID=703511 RepID=A0A6G1HZ32_9PEZI|nr:beta-galactosidase [Trichodelitschia bisporula]